MTYIFLFYSGFIFKANISILTAMKFLAMRHEMKQSSFAHQDIENCELSGNTNKNSNAESI